MLTAIVASNDLKMTIILFISIISGRIYCPTKGLPPFFLFTDSIFLLSSLQSDLFKSSFQTIHRTQLMGGPYHNKIQTERIIISIIFKAIDGSVRC